MKAFFQSIQNSIPDGLLRRTNMWFVSMSVAIGCVLGTGITGHLSHVYGQDKFSDQVGVAILPHAVIGVTSGSGLIKARLSAGERVIATESKGILAFVHTSSRLLGFTSVLQRWREKRLDLSETIQAFHVTPRLILVQTDRHLFGFQGSQGVWKMWDLSLREVVRQIVAEDNVAVVITNKNVLGFSAFTGGFFPEDLSNDEIVQEVNINDNIAILKMPSRQLIFRSQLAVWAEVR